MKLNIGLIGKGKWGIKIKQKLQKLANVKFVCGKNFDYLSKIKKDNINWVFIATPNKTHYKIAKNCLLNNINVFCEKPLCLSEKKANKLIQLANKKKVKIFISDVYDFYSYKFVRLQKINKVYRSKFVSGKDSEFFFRFMYHDISILYKFIANYKIKSYKIFNDFKKKNFTLVLVFKNSFSLKFTYQLYKKKKIHLINNIKISTKKDILLLMIKKILNNSVDFKKNNIKALFILKFINNLKKRIRL